MRSLRHFPCIITHAGRLRSPITDMMQPHHRAYLWALLVHYPEVVTSPVLLNNDSGCWVYHTHPPPFLPGSNDRVCCSALCRLFTLIQPLFYFPHFMSEQERCVKGSHCFEEILHSKLTPILDWSGNGTFMWAEICWHGSRLKSPKSCLM